MYEVTIAMPVYNVEKYVRESLLSALNQTFESIEYLIIDDKGTDNSMSIVHDIIKDHKRKNDIKVITHEMNIGTGATRNTAIDNAQGKYLFLFDSDDILDKHCIETLYNKMIENPVDFIAGSTGAVEITEETTKKSEQFSYQQDDLYIGYYDYAVAEACYNSRLHLPNPVWNRLYNMNFLICNKIKCTPHHVNEDHFFTYQIILNAKSCITISDITYYYYNRNTSRQRILNQYFSLRAAKQYEEISCSMNEYSKKYKNCSFYSKLLKKNYRHAMTWAYKIKKSKSIKVEDKKIIINKMLQYPISFNQIFYIDNKIYHFLLCFFSNISKNTLLVLFGVLYKTYNFLKHNKITSLKE